MRILIDMDGVIYNLHGTWYDLHNQQYGQYHTLTVNDVTDWNTQLVCDRNNCPADIYSYLLDKRVWTNGEVIQNSQAVTREWFDQYHELAIVTAAGNSIAPNRKVSWLKQQFPHISNIFIVSGKQKHWLLGDVLIDDAIHNLEHFTGISILFDQPWNESDDVLPRARDWNHVKDIVAEAERLLQNNTFLYMKENPHKIIQDLLFGMIRNGEL